MKIQSPDQIEALLSAVHDDQPVSGLTHNYYRYPARFSPRFARAAILAFTEPGDVVLDPFMGGATTLVEARASGRHSIGCDVNSLSAFLARVKTTPLREKDLREIHAWVRRLPAHLNLHLPPARAIEWHSAGYQRHVPWPIRKLIELALERLHELPTKRQQRFARCLMLRASQWALDCRERVPAAQEFRDALPRFLDQFSHGMRQYATELRAMAGSPLAKVISVRGAAARLHEGSAKNSLPKRPSLVLTSPPYPGVYVLYHRWKIQGRKESPAPFWVANCLDGQGQAHYCFGHRKQRELRSYFDGICASFSSVRRLIDQSAMVIQIVAFAEPNWQLPRFLEAMSEAGFNEIMPRELGIPVKGRLWRQVPGRRWFALIQGPLATSKELVLFHRPC